MKVRFLLGVCVAVFLVLPLSAFAVDNIEQFPMFKGKCYMSIAHAVSSKPKKGGSDLIIFVMYDHPSKDCFDKDVHEPANLYGVTIHKYKNPAMVVWATNFEWITTANHFYQFFADYKVLPVGQLAWMAPHEVEVYNVVVKLFDKNIVDGQIFKDSILREFHNIKNGGVPWKE